MSGRGVKIQVDLPLVPAKNVFGGSDMFTSMKRARGVLLSTPETEVNGRKMRVTEEQIRWFRLRRSGLVEPFATPEAAARDWPGCRRRS